MVKIFISYAHKDKKYCDVLCDNLRFLEWNKDAEIFYDKDIDNGHLWRDVLFQKLRDSDIVVFLLSTEFIKSDFIRLNEVTPALQMHDNGVADVVLLKLDYVILPQMLAERQIWFDPHDNPLAFSEKPVEAWPYIAEKIGKIVELRKAQNTAKQSGLELLNQRELYKVLIKKLNNAGCVSLCSRTGIGWNSDFDLMNKLPSDSRFLFLDPNSEIFEYDNKANWTPSNRINFASTPEKRKEKAKTLYDELQKATGYAVRTSDFLLPPPFWVISSKDSQLPDDLFITVPVHKKDYGGSLYLHVKDNEDRALSVYSDIFEKLWSYAGEWKSS
jgi:hypothetical protein